MVLSTTMLGVLYQGREKASFFEHNHLTKGKRNISIKLYILQLKKPSQMEVLLVLIFPPPSGILANDAVVCPWAARTEPPSYFELEDFHMSIYSLHHHARDVQAPKRSPRSFVAAPSRDPYSGLSLCPLAVLMATFSCCPGDGLSGSHLLFGHLTPHPSQFYAKSLTSLVTSFSQVTLVPWWPCSLQGLTLATALALLSQSGEGLLAQPWGPG